MLFVLWGVFFTDNLSAVASAALGFLIDAFGWVFILATFAFLVFVIFLAFSRYGRIKLGTDDDEPEFRTSSWVAMMFSVGMGIGLMFYGVAEPISHMSAPPNGLAKPGTEAAAGLAMEYSYFHWALHPWAIYAVVGLSLAYFTFRKGKRNLISSAFYPILGNRVDGPAGKAIDTLAIFATLFGTATSLGLGALQINGGLNYLWDVPNSTAVAILVIAVMTALFILSAVSGVHRGIQWLSNVNMVLAVVLVLFLLVVGPTVFILNTFTESIGGYVSNLVPMSFRTAAFSDADWLASWTIFYWAWWISWTPFVGTFIARISKGRTIREFILGVLVVPSVVTFVWFGVLGGTAINLELSGGQHRRRRGGEPGRGAVRHPQPVPAGRADVPHSRRPGRPVLYQRGRRRGDSDGHALFEGHPGAQQGGGRGLGSPGWRRRCDPSSGRGAREPAAGGHHLRRAVRSGHDLHVLLAL